MRLAFAILILILIPLFGMAQIPATNDIDMNNHDFDNVGNLTVNATTALRTNSPVDIFHLASSPTKQGYGMQSGLNYVYNGGAEIGQPGNSARSAGWLSTGSGPLRYNTSDARRGYYHYPDVGTYYEQTIVLEPGVYNLSFWSRSINASGRAKFRIGSSAAGNDILAFNGPTGTTNWQYTSVSFEIPYGSNIAQRTIYISFTSDSYNTRVDDIMLSPGAIPHAFNPIGVMKTSNQNFYLVAGANINVASSEVPTYNLVVGGPDGAFSQNGWSSPSTKQNHLDRRPTQKTEIQDVRTKLRNIKIETYKWDPGLKRKDFDSDDAFRSAIDALPELRGPEAHDPNIPEAWKSYGQNGELKGLNDSKMLRDNIAIDGAQDEDIQELQAIIADLQARIEKLEKRP